jgi:hypothetical protein
MGSFNDPCPIVGFPWPGIVDAFDNTSGEWWHLGNGGCPGETKTFYKNLSPGLNSFTLNDARNIVWYTRSPGRSLAFAQEKTTHYGFLAVAQPDPDTGAAGIDREQDPDIYIYPDEPVRVLISKQVVTDKYPVDCSTNYPACQSQPAEFKIAVYVSLLPTDLNTNAPNYFWLRVIDPQDRAPYAPVVTTCVDAGACICKMNGIQIQDHACDNKHWPNPTTTRPAVGLIDPVDGLVKQFIKVQVTAAYPQYLTLKTTDRYAGDNYQIQGFYEDPSAKADAHIKFESGILTAWKREYVERDMMFRSGAALVANAVSSNSFVTVKNYLSGANQNSLPACPSTPGASPCYQIAVFDNVTTNESTQDRPYVGYVTNSGSDFDLHLVNLDMSPYTLKSSYTFSKYPTFNDPLAGTPEKPTGNSAGVGVIAKPILNVMTPCDPSPVVVPTAGPGSNIFSCFFSPLTANIKTAFDDAFVEYVYPDAGNSAVPYLPMDWFDRVLNSSDHRYEYFSILWFSHYKEKTLSPNPHQCERNNYFYLMGGNTGVATQQYGGITLTGFNLSYVFVHTFEALGYDQKGTANMVAAACAHEFGHQFDTNACSSQSHDSVFREVWCAGAMFKNCALLDQSIKIPCLMRNNGIQSPVLIPRFESIELLKGDLSCPASQQIDTSIRTQADPY